MVPLFVQFFDLINKGIDVFEFSVYGCKSDIRDLIYFFQAVHDDLTDLCTLHLGSSERIHIVIDVVDQLFQTSCGNRPLRMATWGEKKERAPINLFRPRIISS